jgi:hypothetical protein
MFRSRQAIFKIMAGYRLNSRSGNSTSCTKTWEATAGLGESHSKPHLLETLLVMRRQRVQVANAGKMIVER